MQNARAAAGGARGPHLGHGRRGPEHKERGRGHPGLRAGEGDAGPLPGGQRARDDQAGAVSGCVRRGLLPGVQVSAAAMLGRPPMSLITRVAQKQMGLRSLLRGDEFRRGRKLALMVILDPPA